MAAAEITFNVKKSTIEDVKGAIEELSKDAKKAKDETALTAVKSLEKQVDGFYKSKSKDKTSELKDLFKLYNEAVAEFLKPKETEESEDSKKWTIKKSNDLLSGGVLEGSEAGKLAAWLKGIPEHGPMKAADNAGISCTPLKGGEFHVYLGKKNRVYFTSDQKKKLVSLLRTGHD